MKLALRLPLIAAAVFVLSTCDDLPTDPRASELPSASILDAAHGGNPHFYFLPPLVKAESRPAGVANVKLSPSASLCELDGAGVCAGPDVAVWQSAARPGRASIKVTGESYQLQLRPSDLGLSTSATYRLTVRAGADVLGHVDMRLFSNGRQRNAIDLTQFAAVSVSGTTPVSFVIEDGALCSEQAAGCFETTVTNDGGAFVLEEEASDAEAGVEFPQDALPNDPETGEPQQINLIIERIPLETLPGGRCLPTDLPQFGHCFRFRTEPEVTFTTPVTVGICPTEDAPLPESAQIHRFGEDGTLEALEVADALFLSCDGPSTIGFLPGRAGRLAFAGWEALKSALLPGIAHARDLGLGGLTQSFSRMSWAQPVAMTLHAGDDQTGTAGTAAAVDPTVLVMTANVQPPEEPEPVEGVEIAFEITHADGSVENLTGVTNADGLASVPWTFSATPGVETVVATSPEPDAQTVTFTATTTAPVTGPVSHYAADGDATDAIGSADLTQLGGTVAYGSGISGQAFDFARFSSYLELAPHPTMSSAPETSASLWVNIDPASPKGSTQRFLSLADQFVIRQHGSSTPGNVRDLHFYTRGPTTAAVHLPDVLVTGCWNHVAATVSGGVTSLYLNGVEVFTAPASPRPFAGNLLLSQSAQHEQLDGLMDEVKLFNTGITASDVQQLYSDGAAAAAASGQALCGVPASGPNLTVETVMLMSGTSGPSDVTVHDVRVSIKNTGNAPAPASETHILLDAFVNVVAATPALAPGQADTLTLLRRFAGGAHTVHVSADHLDSVVETDEDDNSAAPLLFTTTSAPVTGAFGSELDLDDSCCGVLPSIDAAEALVGTYGSGVLRLIVDFNTDWDPSRAQARFQLDTDESSSITAGDYFLTIVPLTDGGYEVNLRESVDGSVVWSRIRPAELMVTATGYDFVMPLSDINDSGEMLVRVETEQRNGDGSFTGLDLLPGTPAFFEVLFAS